MMSSTRRRPPDGRSDVRRACGDPGTARGPIITLEEQMRGWLALIRRVPEIQRQVVYYERLLSLIVFFAVWEVLPFDRRAAATFARLRRQRVRIGTMDLKIA